MKSWQKKLLRCLCFLVASPLIIPIAVVVLTGCVISYIVYCCTLILVYAVFGSFYGIDAANKWIKPEYVSVRQFIKCVIKR